MLKAKINGMPSLTILKLLRNQPIIQPIKSLLVTIVAIMATSNPIAGISHMILSWWFDCVMTVDHPNQPAIQPTKRLRVTIVAITATSNSIAGISHMILSWWLDCGQPLHKSYDLWRVYLTWYTATQLTKNFIGNASNTEASCMGNVFLSSSSSQPAIIQNVLHIPRLLTNLLQFLILLNKAMVSTTWRWLESTTYILLLEAKRKLACIVTLTVSPAHYYPPGLIYYNFFVEVMPW